MCSTCVRRVCVCVRSKCVPIGIRHTVSRQGDCNFRFCTDAIPSWSHRDGVCNRGDSLRWSSHRRGLDASGRVGVALVLRVVFCVCAQSFTASYPFFLSWRSSHRVCLTAWFILLNEPYSLPGPIKLNDGAVQRSIHTCNLHTVHTVAAKLRISSARSQKVDKVPTLHPRWSVGVAGHHGLAQRPGTWSL